MVACGARTGLLIPEADEGGSTLDGGPDAPRDHATDPVTDPIEEDVADVIEEGLPQCDPEALYVYLITEQSVFYRYDPAHNEFLDVGFLSCPAGVGATPFSMGVDRKGRAYVVYNDGELFLVDVTTLECDALDFEIGQQGFVKFGMGFAIDDDMMGESLYVAEISFTEPSLGLGKIDTQTLELGFIGQFSESFGNAMEMTSSDDGQLYAYQLDGAGSGGHILRIDKATAEILEQTPIPVGSSASALAFAYWNGDFYIFTSPGGPTTVARYSPSSGTLDPNLTSLPETVVGAGVSTCKVHD